MSRQRKIQEKFMADISAHQGIIHKICILYLKDEREREDLFQQILLNAWKSYAKFERRSSFATWLYRVALNTALMRIRNSRATSRQMLGKTAHPGLNSVSYSSGNREEKKSLYTAIERLEDIERSIVFLYLDGLNYRDMAEITGLSETHLGVKINRIKEKLRNIVEKGG